MDIIKIIRDLLQTIINKIDSGNSNITEDEAYKIIDMLSYYTDKEEKLSREQAAKYLNMNLRTFDRHVALGKIKEGEKLLGFKEKFFLKKDLDEVIKKSKELKVKP